MAKSNENIEITKTAINMSVSGKTVTVDAIFANGNLCVDIPNLQKLGLQIEYDEGKKQYVILNGDEFVKLLKGEDKYHKMLQGKAVNAISKVRTRNLFDQVNEIGNAEIWVDDTFTLKIKDYEKFKKGVTTTTYMLLDCFLIHFTEQPVKDVCIRLPLKKYMEMRNLSDPKSARAQVVKDMKALELIQYEAEEKVKGKWVKSGNVSIYGGTGFIKNGIIHFNFNVDFFKALLNYKVMEYSKETLKVNPKLYPHAYYFSRYLDENYRMNEGKERVSTITVQTLISKAPQLPSYDEIIQSPTQKGMVYEFIIMPVIRDLDSIDRLYYDFLDIKGNVIDDPVAHFKGIGGYQEFIMSKIRVDYSDYEQHDKRIERRNRYAESVHFIKNPENKK